jgi:MFS family permease
MAVRRHSNTTPLQDSHVAFHISSNEISNNNGNSNNNKTGSVSYWKLLQTNREFRLLILSRLISQCGEWLTYIATIDFIEGQLLSQAEEGEEETTTDGSSSSSPHHHHRTAISILIVIRLLPNVLLAALGGSLADARDRRQAMIVLDVAGAISALLFCVAYYFQSLFLMYLVSFLQQCIGGLYQPSMDSVLPMTVTTDQELQKATTLSGLVWSTMATVGSALGGFLVAQVGSYNCFCTLW